jgi:DNA replication and repair protein RecF
MALAEFSVQDLRCIERAELALQPGSNLIFGPNGAGKTSLLEAIFLLGRGRSFRTRLTERLIRHGQSQLRVIGRTGSALPLAASPGSAGRRPAVGGQGRPESLPAGLEGQGAAHAGALQGVVDGDLAPSGVAAPLGVPPVLPQQRWLPHALGLEVTRDGGTRARLDAQNVRSLADLATAFPVQVLDPDAHRLIEDSATRRRRWLDWAVFHVEPGFAVTWARYSRALQQRNAVLRSGHGDLGIWDVELVKDGDRITEARRRVLTALQPYWAEVSRGFLDEDLSLSFQAGWDRETSLATALADAVPRDRLRKTTTVGPHRADVAMRIRGKPVREVLSRGQQKLAAVAMTLCQLEYLKQEHEVLPTLLLDDPSAELDRTRLDRFISRVKALQTQLIVTALDRDFSLFGMPDAVFHVEQGKVLKG